MLLSRWAQRLAKPTDLNRRTIATVSATVAIAFLGMTVPGFGQDMVRRFSDPILRVETQGHQAPIRSIVFAPGGTQLLSAGSDKTVRVWDLTPAEPTLTRTLRPPVFRGYAGAIYTLALAPAEHEPGQRRLALAGYGVESNRGEIVFFRYPGAANLDTGDLLARIPAGDLNQPNKPGHLDSINSLAFDPTASLLASAGNDGVVILWDVNTLQARRIWRGHVGSVNSLAFSSDGRHVVSGGSDGTIRVWSVTADAATATLSAPGFAPGQAPRAWAVNSLALHPDGRTVIFGRENGMLQRADVQGQQAGMENLPVLPGQGPVEVVAISPDGKQLAVSVIQTMPAADRVPVDDCEVQVRSLPDAAIVRRFSTSSFTYALAFSSDNRRLAFAGDDRQRLFIHDLTAPQTPLRAWSGQGGTVHDVRFTADSKKLGYTQSPLVNNAPAEAYEGFDLVERTRLIAPLRGADLRGALTSFEGWSVQPVDAYTLVASHQDGQRRWTLALDPLRDRRWWCFSFLPPSATHPLPMLAVGCELGIALYRLDTGERTRFLAGHAAPILGLAPSPDGLWLASCSLDQTIMLWTLDRANELTPLGARFERDAQARWSVASVERRSFADAMGMQRADRIEIAVIGRTPYRSVEEIDQFMTLVEKTPPDRPIQFRVRRSIAMPRPATTLIDAPLILNTTKRQTPALTLFMGADREWVFWTPQGYYDCSIAGDDLFLGWHLNRGVLERSPSPTVFLPISAFEARLRQPRGKLPNVLDRLIETGLLVAPDAAEDARPILADIRSKQPPDVEILAGRLDQGLRARIRQRPESRPFQEIEARVGGRLVARLPLDRLQNEASLTLPPMTLPDPEVPLWLQFNSKEGDRLDVVLPIENKGTLIQPQATARPPRLGVVSLGVEQFPKQPLLGTIAHAAADATDLSKFAARYLLSSETGKPFGSKSAKLLVSTGEAQSWPALLQALESNSNDEPSEGWRSGDLLLVLLESHGLAGNDAQSGRIALRETPASNNPQQATPAIVARDVSMRLKTIADSGARVIVVLDLIHANNRGEPRTQSERWIREWTRELKSFALVLVANKDGPSLRSEQHGALIEAVLRTVTAQGQLRRTEDSRSTLVSLDAFESAVKQIVGELTQRSFQLPELYLPRGVKPNTTLLDLAAPAP